MCHLPYSGLQRQHVPMQNNQQELFIGQVFLTKFAGFDWLDTNFGCHAPCQFELLCVSYNATGEELLSVERSTGPFVLIWSGLAGVRFWCVEMVRDAIMTSYESCSLEEKQLTLPICMVDGPCFTFWITLKTPYIILPPLFDVLMCCSPAPGCATALLPSLPMAFTVVVLPHR